MASRRLVLADRAKEIQGHVSKSPPVPAFYDGLITPLLIELCMKKPRISALFSQMSTTLGVPYPFRFLRKPIHYRVVQGCEEGSPITGSRNEHPCHRT